MDEEMKNTRKMGQKTGKGALSSKEKRVAKENCREPGQGP